MLLQTAVNEYLASLNNSSKHTSRSYARYLNRFLEFTGNIDLVNLTVELVGKYREFLDVWTDPENGKSLKAATKNYYLIALRSLIAFLSEKHALNVKPEDIFLEAQDPKYLQILSPDQLDIILKAPDLSAKEGLRDRLILEILADTGLRVSEIVTLNTDSLSSVKMEISMNSNGKVRTVKLPDTALPIFNGYMIIRKDAFVPLFIRFQGVVDLDENGEKMRLSQRSIERIVQKYGKKARVEALTPQVLRNSYATNMLKNGEEVETVAEILGHTNIDSTKVYARVKVGF